MTDRDETITQAQPRRDARRDCRHAVVSFRLSCDGCKRRLVPAGPGAGVGLADVLVRPRRSLAEACRRGPDRPDRRWRTSFVLARPAGRRDGGVEPHHPVARYRHRRALPVRAGLRKQACARVRRSRQGACSQHPRACGPGLGRGVAEAVPPATTATNMSAPVNAGGTTAGGQYPRHPRHPSAAAGRIMSCAAGLEN